MKLDKDDTNYNQIAASYNDREDGCLFCDTEREPLVMEHELCYAVIDSYPVTELHTLIISKRHVASYFDLYQPEITAMHTTLARMKLWIEERDTDVTGFNIGINAGRDAGQSIFHVHMHLIPRRKGDIDNPQGGVRGVIPSKRKYQRRK